DFDEANWEEINRLRFDIAKDSNSGKSLLTRAREALDRKEYDVASDLQIEIQTKVEELKKKYADYKRNLF
ncbi:MAG: glutamine synthetase, partial [Firmicutes bacterium]|nr:glutamine synthetase [Bacillota bacterium]